MPFIELVASGVQPTPLNKPERFTFEYTNGATLILEGDSLMLFYQELVSALSHQVASAQQFPSIDTLRKQLQKSERTMPKREESDKEE